MKKIIKTIFYVIAIVITISVIICTIVGLQGYKMYKDTISKTSIDDRIEQLKSNDNYLELNKIPEYFKDAIVAVEDHRFKSHGGIDIISTCRAILNNIKAMSIVEGGSTITQQLAKNLYFSQEQDFVRKVAELFAALDLEKDYSKDDILEFYLNTIYFGNGYYGIYDASMGYFNKPPKDLTIKEATLLAGIPNAPSVYALTENPDLAKQRQAQVLDAMVNYNYITDQEAENILE